MKQLLLIVLSMTSLFANIATEPLWEDEFYTKRAYLFAVIFLKNSAYKLQGNEAITELKKFIKDHASLSEEEFDKRMNVVPQELEGSYEPAGHHLYEVALQFTLIDSCERFIEFRKHASRTRNSLMGEESKAASLNLALYNAQELNDDNKITQLVSHYRSEERKMFEQKVLDLLENWNNELEKITAISLVIEAKCAAEQESLHQGCCSII